VEVARHDLYEILVASEITLAVGGGACSISAFRAALVFILALAP
jgi:hypothetical protein